MNYNSIYGDDWYNNFLKNPNSYDVEKLMKDIDNTITSSIDEVEDLNKHYKESIRLNNISKEMLNKYVEDNNLYNNKYENITNKNNIANRNYYYSEQYIEKYEDYQKYLKYILIVLCLVYVYLLVYKPRDYSRKHLIILVSVSLLYYMTNYISNFLVKLYEHYTVIPEKTYQEENKTLL